MMIPDLLYGSECRVLTKKTFQ